MPSTDPSSNSNSSFSDISRLKAVTLIRPSLPERSYRKSGASSGTEACTASSPWSISRARASILSGSPRDGRSRWRTVLRTLSKDTRPDRSVPGRRSRYTILPSVTRRLSTRNAPPPAAATCCGVRWRRGRPRGIRQSLSTSSRAPLSSRARIPMSPIARKARQATPRARRLSSSKRIRSADPDPPHPLAFGDGRLVPGASEAERRVGELSLEAGGCDLDQRVGTQEHPPRCEPGLVG